MAVLHWVAAFVLFGAFFLALPVLWDTDSYYHLAVARLYAFGGPAASVPWARFSLIGSGADKEWLFHLLLLPFAAIGDPAVGGRIALAVLNATLATIVALIAARALGNAGFAVPLWLWISAPLFFARVVRLRPELLALTILLLAAIVAAERRYIGFGLLAFAFTIGYTAFHVFAAMAVLWFAWSFYRTRQAETGLLIAPLAGVAAGLVLRPHPVANLKLWYVQNVVFFANMQWLDVGNEIAPPNLIRAVSVSALWIIALVAFIAIARRSRSSEVSDARAKSNLAYLTIAAAVFVVLFFRFGRMALYAFPLTSLAVVIAFGRRIRPRVAATIFGAATILALPIAFGTDKLQFIRSGTRDVSELDWNAFGRAVPRDAKIAARWSDADAYVFFAPQGRYLNVLDPTFMAVPYPRRYTAQRRLFEGTDPDLPRTAARVLDSDYIALDWTLASGELVHRLRSDPRLEVVYGGYNALFRVRPPKGVRFVTDWQPLAQGADPLAGYVDATVIAQRDCATLTHVEVIDHPERRVYEFTPWGRSALAIDGTVRASIPDSRRALLGFGSRVEVAFSAGSHHFDVRTCHDHGSAGFFLVDRTPGH
ncbi:MAG TPA: hypothetical protein VF980_06355 [Thermoanaerobaculia bacterium]